VLTTRPQSNVLLVSRVVGQARQNEDALSWRQDAQSGKKHKNEK
jgi:hypothetical protein